MPYTFTLKSTPKGREYVEVIASGQIDIADANQFNESFRDGGRFGGKSLVAVMKDDSKYTVEGRKTIIAGVTVLPAIAVVVTSAPLRVMLNFMMKASAAAAAVGAAQAQAGNTRTFGNVGDATAWLDAELDKKAA